MPPVGCNFFNAMIDNLISPATLSLHVELQANTITAQKRRTYKLTSKWLRCFRSIYLVLKGGQILISVYVEDFCNCEGSSVQTLFYFSAEHKHCKYFIIIVFSFVKLKLLSISVFKLHQLHWYGFYAVEIEERNTTKKKKIEPNKRKKRKEKLQQQLPTISYQLTPRVVSSDWDPKEKLAQRRRRKIVGGKWNEARVNKDLPQYEAAFRGLLLVQSCSVPQWPAK